MNKAKFKIFLLIIFSLFSITSIFNFIINPYDAFNIIKIKNINYFKPYEKHNRFLSQFNRLLFETSKNYVIGSSTATTIFQPSDINIKNIENDFYNLGIPGQNFYSNFRTIEHLLNTKDVNTIILNLDFFNFWIIKELRKGYVDYRFSINHNNDKRIFSFLKTYFLFFCLRMQQYIQLKH